MNVWVVMERWLISDDGDDAIEVEAVHRTRAGAEANLKPDYGTNGCSAGTRERYIVEMKLLD